MSIFEYAQKLTQLGKVFGIAKRVEG